MKLPSGSDSPAGLWTTRLWKTGRGPGLAAAPPHGYPSRAGLPDPPRSLPGSADAPYDPHTPPEVAHPIGTLRFHYLGVVRRRSDPYGGSRCRAILGRHGHLRRTGAAAGSGARRAGLDRAAARCALRRRVRLEHGLRGPGGPDRRGLRRGPRPLPGARLDRRAGRPPGRLGDVRPRGRIARHGPAAAAAGRAGGPRARHRNAPGRHGHRLRPLGRLPRAGAVDQRRADLGPFPLPARRVHPGGRAQAPFVRAVSYTPADAARAAAAPRAGASDVRATPPTSSSAASQRSPETPSPRTSAAEDIPNTGTSSENGATDEAG